MLNLKNAFPEDTRLLSCDFVKKVLENNITLSPDKCFGKKTYSNSWETIKEINNKIMHIVKIVVTVYINVKKLTYVIHKNTERNGTEEIL